MPVCHDMKEGDVYVCEDCGLELKVIKSCASQEGSHACKTHDDDSDPCKISCCGKELKVKS